MMVQAQVHTNPEQPRPKSSRRVKLIEAFVNPEKCLLGQIFGLILIPDKPPDYTQQATLVPLHELCKGSLRSAASLFHEAGIDYVSCSAYRVPVARLAAAQAVLRHR